VHAHLERNIKDRKIVCQIMQTLPSSNATSKPRTLSKPLSTICDLTISGLYPDKACRANNALSRACFDGESGVVEAK